MPARGEGMPNESAGWPPQNGVVMYIGIGTVILIIILILLLT